MRLMMAALALLLAVAPAAAQEPDSAAYGRLVERALAGDTTVDPASLRLALVASAHYSPYGSSLDDTREALEAAVERDDFAAVVRAADAILAADYTDIDAHVWKSWATEMLGDSALSRRHQAFATGLIDAILDSGEGSEESPWVVISVREEYTILKVLGCRSMEQNLGQCAGKRCDVLRVKDVETGEETTLHFDVSIPYGHMRRQLMGGDGVR